MSSLQPIDPESIDLNVIKAPAVVSARHSEPYDREIKEYQSARNKLRNRELEQKIAARGLYVSTVFWMVAIWIGLIYVLLILEGFGIRGFRLPDNVLLAAIGSTTANVLALLYMIVKFLFSEEQEKK